MINNCWSLDIEWNVYTIDRLMEDYKELIY